jgi:hypothetical protein
MVVGAGHELIVIGADIACGPCIGTVLLLFGVF